MNILLLSTWFPYPPDNGSKIRVHQLLHALSQDHRVTTVAFAQPGDTAGQPAEALELHAVQADPFRYVGLPQMVKYLSPVPLAFWHVRQMADTVTRLQVREHWDAVVAVQVPMARHALQGSNIPRILDVDTSLSHQLRDRHERQTSRIGRMRAWFSWYKAYRYERSVFRQFQICTVVSPLEIDPVRAMAGPGVRVEVIPNGVDCAHNRPGLAKPSPNSLVYNGALTYSANYDAVQYFLAEIYPLVRRQIPGVTFSITGSTQGVDMDNLQLDDSVCFTGYVEDIRMPVTGSAACVVPIRQGGGTRLKILEAMALGTPVVATTKGAEGLDVMDGEHLLLADDPVAFAEATVRILQDATLHRRLSANARQLVEAEYDWAKIGQQFVALVEETVLRRKQGVM